MKHSHLMYLCAAGFLITACADDPSSPSRTSAIRFNQSAAVEGTYLVRFKGNGVPASFEATVSKLGGEVIFAHGGAGVAGRSRLDSICG